MREGFSAYYRPSDEYLSEVWNDGIVVPDTNVLLHLYRYSGKAREEMLQLMESLKERLWIPHQVAREYLENRTDVIVNHLRMYDQTRELIRSLQQYAEREFAQSLNYTDHPVLKELHILELLQDKLDDLLDYLTEQESAHPFQIDEDPLQERIEALFKESIGSACTTEELQTLYSTGEERYENRIPPGYSDAVGEGTKEGPKRYGDLVLWFQILDRVGEVRKPLLFITNDSKEDWWWIANGEYVAPRPELIEEVREKVGVPFYMYDSPEFLTAAGQYLGWETSDEAEAELLELRKRDALFGKTELKKPATLTELQNKIEAMENELGRMGEILKKLG